MNLAIIRKKRFCTFKFFIPITLTPEPKDLESGVFYCFFFPFFLLTILIFFSQISTITQYNRKIVKMGTIYGLPLY